MISSRGSRIFAIKTTGKTHSQITDLQSVWYTASFLDPAKLNARPSTGRKDDQDVAPGPDPMPVSGQISLQPNLDPLLL